MRRLTRKAVRYTIISVLLWAGFCALLTLAAAVPRKYAEKNMTAAAEYYQGREDRYELVAGEKTTVVQDYSNAIWLNVAWNFDEDKPFVSAMEANYYQAEDKTQPDSFAACVLDGEQADTGYGRYWHGTAALLRLLLCVMPFQGVMVLAGAMLLALLALYFVLLLRRKLYAAAIGSALACLLCTIWVVPFSFEYAPCFLITFAASDYVLWRGGGRDYSGLFLVLGAVVCFFDFLTCEILSFALPMLLILCMNREPNRAGLRKTFVYGCFWFASYALSFVVKWLLASAVSGESLRSIALAQGAYRVAGELAVGGGLLGRMVVSLTTNLNFLFPMSLAASAGGVWLIFIGVAAAIFCVWFLFRKKPNVGLWPMWLLFLLPSARYVIMSNHGAMHPFFTFRCMFVSVAALCVILSETTDFMQFSKRAARRKPRKRSGK